MNMSSTKSILVAVLATVGLISSGCSMCCGPYDYHYPVFGGKLQRANPEYGRVGSVFSDPYVALGPSADSNLDPIPYEEPTSVDADDDIEDPTLDDFDPDLDDFDSDIDSELDLEQYDPDIMPDPGPETITPRETNPSPIPDDSNTEARRWRSRPLRNNQQQRWR